MLHTSFEVVVSLKVIFYPNGFLEKKNYAKTRPGSDFSTMSYRKGERIAMWLPCINSEYLLRKYKGIYDVSSLVTLFPGL